MVLASADAWAQRDGESPTSLPGVDRVAHADSFARFAAAALSVGYGYTGGVINANSADGHHRAASSLALSIRPLPYLAVAFQYDNRYDKHVDLEEGDGKDDGWLAESRLSARYVRPLSPQLGLGVEATVWFPPGGSPPSFSASGTSFEGTLIATYVPMPALRVSANAGYRLDRSVDSIDNAAMLSTADRLALGVSEFDAILGGVGATYSFGDFDILAEATWDILVGSGNPPLAQSPLRASGGGRWRVTDSMQVQLLAQGSPSEVGDFSTMGSLYRVDPSFSTMLTVSYSHPVKGPAVLVAEPDCEKNPDDPRCAPAKPLEPGKLWGTVTDEGGNPVANAKVTVVLNPTDPNAGGPLTIDSETDAEGNFKIEGQSNAEPLPDGTGSVTVEAEGYEPKTSSVEVKKGQLSRVALPLQEKLPVGQLRGVIQAFNGTPLKATVTVQPGDASATAEDDGSFEIDLQPGEYQVTITAAGYAEQTRTVSIEKNGVTIMNVDMRAAK